MNMALSMEADISTSTKIFTLEAASVTVSLYVITIGAITLVTLKIQMCPDGHMSTWSHGLTSLDRPLGLAGSGG